jgi:single-stranded DNA-specific DHH superfamily exonuclease
MSHYDIFNGDADGLCSLQQLRLASPCEAAIVTGAKRDSALVARIHARPGDIVTVLDVSLDRNSEAIGKVLEAGAEVIYFDHHYASTVPSHDRFKAYIENSPGVCTSTLVDRHLNGMYRPWAAVGAFGDEIRGVGFALANSCGLNSEEASMLQSLGQLLNYNAYGDSTADLHFHPEELARLIRPYADPCEFFKSSQACQKLALGYKEDMANTDQLKPEFESDSALVIILPDLAWARRVRGILANRVSANQTRALAVLSPDQNGGYMVSVRAPLIRPVGADLLCRQFENGGGRAAAAGINHLPKTDVDRFISHLNSHFAALSREQ